MSAPANILVQVQTYQKAELAFLLNSFCAISLSDKKFENFQDKVANLGDTVTFDLAPRFIAYNGLVITNQPSAQRVQSLACTQAVNVAAGYTDQQFIFNVRDYMDRFGMAAMKEIGSVVEADILRNAVSGVRINDPQNANFGALQTNSGPYRFYGDGTTFINSSGQLAQAIANFRNYGAAEGIKGILPDTIIPQIVQTNLNQFAMDRNNKEAMSWELGRFSETDWYQSNLLPTHISGDIGNAVAPNNLLTIVSVNDPTGQNVTQITCTEPTAGTSATAILSGDLGQFTSATLRYLTFIGHQQSSQSVQIRMTADAATVAGTVTISITPALVWAQTQNQNLNQALAAGMTIRIVPSHRAGLIYSGHALYLAMPRLPDLSPYVTVNETDMESGASIRHYFGSQFGQNVRSYVRDTLWGSTLVPENSMRVLFPLAQA